MEKIVVYDQDTGKVLRRTSDDNVGLVETSAVTYLSTSIGKNNIVLSGCTEKITTVGFVWDETPNVTRDSNYIDVGGGDVQYNLTGLTTGTTYYYRMVYRSGLSNEVSVTTLNLYELGDTYLGGTIIWLGTNVGYIGADYEYLEQVEGINYCDNLVEGGYSDWTLPSPTEMNNISTSYYNNPDKFPNIYPKGLLGVAHWTDRNCPYPTCNPPSYLYYSVGSLPIVALESNPAATMAIKPIRYFSW